MMDRNLDAERPLAIGQKHIIVTCNYAARAMGITKLMDRKKAQEMGGAALLIVDGSDLQRYRIYARKIYESFRKSIKSVDAKSRVRKGCMDEMIADISTVPFWNSCSADTFMNHLHDIFIYDDVSYGASDAVTLTEDQSGAQTTFTRRAYSESLRSIPSKSDHGVEEFHTQLRQAAVFAMQIRQSMLDKTGFTVTMGISYNSMMAKIASGIKKPGRVNVLLPCVAAQQLIHAMPLRKIHGIGSRTMKALKPCLEQRHGRKCDNDSPWTCRYEGTSFSCFFDSYFFN
jgi:DNA polymerase iota